MGLLVVYVILAVLVGVIAHARGRSGAGWFLLAVLLSPLIAVIVVGLLPSRVVAPVSLESQVRDRMLEARFAPLIRSHKPAFSNRLVHDVTLNGQRRRFGTKAEAIAFCMTQTATDGATQITQAS